MQRDGQQGNATECNVPSLQRLPSSSPAAAMALSARASASSYLFLLSAAFLMSCNFLAKLQKVEVLAQRGGRRGH